MEVTSRVRSLARHKHVGATWVLAALLAVVLAIAVALWVHNTGGKVDRESVARGAESVAAHVEERLSTIALSSTAIESFLSEELDRDDIAVVAASVDRGIITSMLGVVEYSIDTDGDIVGRLDSKLGSGYSVAPDLGLDADAFLSVFDSSGLYLSPPTGTETGDGAYALVGRSYASEVPGLIGFAFSIQDLLSVSVEASGDATFSAELIDVRHDRVVASVGEASSDIRHEVPITTIDDIWVLSVAPGEGFAFSQAWPATMAIVAVGLVIAVLLLRMANVVRERDEELSERLRLAEELNTSKDRFLAAVSHELRTPLTVVLGVAEEVGHNWDSVADSDRSDLLAMMGEQAREASHIVEDLLVAARTDPSQLQMATERTGVWSHVDYALSSLAGADADRVRRVGADQVLLADTTRLRQVLRNLLENAIRYGGPDVEVATQRDRNSIHIVVSDDGSALRPEDINQIFEPYERVGTPSNSPSGVGIGLFVSRLLARRMDGELSCRIETGRTMFDLELPAVLVEFEDGRMQGVAG